MTLVYDSHNVMIYFSIPPFIGMSSGAIVGIVFAVLIIVLAATLVGFFFYKQQTTFKSPDIVGLQTTGFENVLYSGSEEGVNFDKKQDVTPGSDA